MLNCLLSLLGAGMSHSHWEEGPMMALLHAPRMQPSVTEGALLFCLINRTNLEIHFSIKCNSYQLCEEMDIY